MPPSLCFAAFQHESGIFLNLARCPYCGKWSAVRIQSIAKLREAEQAELEWGKAEVVEETEEEKLRREINEFKISVTEK